MIMSKLVALESQISEALPPLRVKNMLMLLPPIQQVLRGIWFDRSANDEISFSVTVFLMPLCVPTDHLYFNFGNRVRHEGGGDRWNTNMPRLATDLIVAIKQQALPYLANGNSLESFVQFARSGTQSGRALEGMGYAAARCGNTKQAIEIFGRLIPMLDPKVAWQHELKDRVRALSAALAENPEAVQDQLAKLEEDTVHKLDLAEFYEAAA